MGIVVRRLWQPLVLSCLNLLVHAIPFWTNANPLGYDTGFYRRYLIEPFTSFPNPPVPGLGPDALLPRLILDTLRLAGLSADLALYSSYVAFSALLPALCYWWLQPRLGARGASIAGILLALSPVGYTAFWYMLYKNAFALCLMVIAFIMYERKQFWAVLLVSISIAFSHKTSTMIYLVTLGILFLLERVRRKEIFVYSMSTGVCVALLILLQGGTLTPRSFGSQAVGVFLSWGDYLIYSFGLFLVAGYALYHRVHLTLPPTLAALTLASFAFPVLRLPFFERIFVFTNVALTALAAYGLNLLITKIDFDATKRSYIYFIVICIVVGLQVGNLQTRIRELEPLQSSANLTEIERVGTLVPPGALLLTTNAEAPWYEGWTTAHIAAPGMLKDTHNFEAWVAFWEATSTVQQVAFLNTFPQPLYVSTLGPVAKLVNTPPPCFTRVADHLLRNDCNHP